MKQLFPTIELGRRLTDQAKVNILLRINATTPRADMKEAVQSGKKIEFVGCG